MTCPSKGKNPIAYPQRAVAVHDLISPCPHSDKLSMCSRSSGQVITPGVASGATKSGQVHLGKAPTSLHMSTQTPASLFCRATRCFKSSDKHDFTARPLALEIKHARARTRIANLRYLFR